MARTLIQKLYLEGLSPGLNMTIMDVKPSVPSDAKWEVEFDLYNVGSVAINRYGPVDKLSGQYPITVATSTVPGLIGVVKFKGHSLFYSTGTGAKVDITIRIQGTTDVNGTSYNVDQKGYISVSATDWKWTARPDYTNISYYWGDTAPAVLSISVPPTQPADAYFRFGLTADGKQIVVNTTLHKGFWANIADWLLYGTFYGLNLAFDYLQSWALVYLNLKPSRLFEWLLSFVRNVRPVSVI